MAAIKDPKFFAPGKIIYHVYGHLIKNSDADLVSNIQKLICTSGVVHNGDKTSSKFISVIRCSHVNDLERNEGYNSKSYLSDMGIFDDPHRRPYNLNRAFASIPDALEYIIQIKSNMMELPEDQSQLNYYQTEEYKDSRDSIFRSRW